MHMNEPGNFLISHMERVLRMLCVLLHHHPPIYSTPHVRYDFKKIKTLPAKQKTILFLPFPGELKNKLASVQRKLGYSGHLYTSEIKSSREKSFRREVGVILPLICKQTCSSG